MIPHEEIKEQFIRAHIPEDKLVAFGIPVSRKFQNKPEKKQARDYLRLSQEGKYVLLIGGSMAAGNMRALLKELIDKSSSEIRIIVICGNNKRLFNRLTRKYRKNERVIIEGSTKQMPLYMSACDLMFSKPGGLTSTEAAVANIPLVHTKPIPGCETKNLRFFVKRHMSISGKTVALQVSRGLKLLNTPSKQEEMIRSQKQYISKDAAKNKLEAHALRV